jgi:hypothetical protein
VWLGLADPCQLIPPGLDSPRGDCERFNNRQTKRLSRENKKKEIICIFSLKDY